MKTTIDAHLSVSSSSFPYHSSGDARKILMDI